MCVFEFVHAKNQERVKGLLTLKNFPIPLPEDDFGGDVVIGWRSWQVVSDYLRSPFRSDPWIPGEPIAMLYGDTPNPRTGRGVYAYLDRDIPQAESWPAYGRVALFGNVITFEKDLSPATWGDGDQEGAMAQYAFPLEVYIKNYYRSVASSIARQWKPFGVKFYCGGKPV